jgi:hypothetical protein
MAATALCLILAFAAHAQQPSADGQRPPGETSDNPSNKLDRSGGVVRPPEVDPGMQRQPPPSADKMPVVPPPGSPGGDPNVRPK